MFLLVVGYIRGNFSPVPARRCFSGRLRVYPREFFSCTRAAVFFRPVAGISARFSLLYPRGATFTTSYGYIRAFFSPVPARRYFYDRLRVYPREIFSCTRAALLFRLPAGISAGNLLLYPRALGICLPSARSRLVARAAVAKIRLRRIKHRRVQTAADGLCLRA